MKKKKPPIRGLRFRENYPILTSPEVYKEEVTKRNALNRSRGKAMERRIATYLSGDVVPLSGAMKKYKGDVIVDLKNNAGKYFVECKMSAKLFKGQPSIPLFSSFFPKMRQEASDMKAKFYCLIIHYHGRRMDYVLLDLETIELLVSRYSVNSVLLSLYSAANIINGRKVDGAVKHQHALHHHVLEEQMMLVEGIRGVVLDFDRKYLIIDIETFRDLVKDL